VKIERAFSLQPQRRREEKEGLRMISGRWAGGEDEEGGYRTKRGKIKIVENMNGVFYHCLCIWRIPVHSPPFPLSISAAKRNLMNSSYTLIFFLHPNNLLCWLGCPEQGFCFILARLKAEKNDINKVGIGFLLLPTSFCRQVFFVRQITNSHSYMFIC
jgi:hypothetical protein